MALLVLSRIDAITLADVELLVDVPPPPARPHQAAEDSGLARGAAAAAAEAEAEAEADDKLARSDHLNHNLRLGRGRPPPHPLLLRGAAAG